jgi:molybdate-binding protein
VLARYAPLIDARKHRLVHLVRRTQGLMLTPGNPLKIGDLVDLARPGVRYVNRQSGSGTRLLFDELLSERGIAPANINGYQNEEFTHAAVAAFVASGMADAGMGVAAAAAQFKLDFQPIVLERYFLLLRADVLKQPPYAALLDLIRSAEFTHAVADLAGYDAAGAGTVLSVGEAFPWFTAGNTSPPAPARKKAHRKQAQPDSGKSPDRKPRRAAVKSVLPFG